MNAADDSISAPDPLHRDRHHIADDCWQVLVQSVHAGRPMTLPNLLRLYRRRRHAKSIGAAGAADDASGAAVDAALLRHAYRRQQPFRPRSSLTPLVP